MWNKPVLPQLGVDNLAIERYWNLVSNGTYGAGMDRTIRFGARIEF